MQDRNTEIVPDGRLRRTTDGRDRRFPRILLALTAAAVCMTCALFFTKLYDDNLDNYIISLVVNGLFDDTGQCQLLHPVLGRMLRALSRLLPAADSFMITAHILAFLEVFWLMNLLLREKKGALLPLAGFLLLLLASVELKLFNDNFTIQAATFAMTGMITLLYAQRRGGSRGDSVIGALFFAAGAMWRRGAALLSLPFLFLSMAITVFAAEDRSKALKKTCLLLVPFLCTLAFLTVTDVAMNAGEAQRNAKKYQESRTLIVDYPFRPWEEVSERAEEMGITETDYYAARNWMLIDTERLDADKLEKIAGLGNTLAFPCTARGILDAARLSVKTVLNSWLGIMVGASALVGLAVFSNWRRLELLLSGLGTLMILVYFVMLGHTPERLWDSILLLPLSLLLSDLILGEKLSGRNYDRILACLLLLCAVWRFAALLPELKPIKPQLAVNARVCSDESEYAELLEGDNIYIWAPAGGPIWEVDPVMRQGKLLSEDFVSQMINAGGWTYGQPFFDSYLKRLGLQNPAAALLERSDVFLISDRPGLALAVLEQRAEGPVKAEEVGSIRWFTIYAISAGP